MTVTTNEYGQQNMFAKEPVMYYENYGMLSPNMVKERTNGRWAMMGIVAGFISYAATGNFFFGIFWDLTMTSLLFTITSVAFFVLLAHSVNQLSETY